MNVDLPDKEAVLRFAVDAFARQGAIADPKRLYDGLRAREELLSTGIGNGISIPHTGSAEAKDAALLLLRLASPIDFQSLDALPVDVVVAVVVPEDESILHLRILAGISRLCRHAGFMKAVREAETPHGLHAKIKEIEEQAAAR